MTLKRLLSPPLPQWMQLKKWASIAGLILSPILPIYTLNWVFGLPLFYGMVYFFALWISAITIKLFNYNFFKPTFLTKEKRLYCPRNKIENEIATFICELATKAQIPTPMFIILKSPPEKQLHLYASSSGWPFKPTITLTQDTLDLYRQKKLTKATLIAVLAHEIAHIKNQDLLILILTKTLKAVSKLYWFSSVLISIFFFSIFTVVIALSFWQNIAITAIFTSWLPALSVIIPPLVAKIHVVINKILHHTSQRAREFLADYNGAKLTENPQATSLMLHELCLHELRWGTLVTENHHGETLLINHRITANTAKKMYKTFMSKNHPHPGIWHQGLTNDINNVSTIVPGRWHLKSFWNSLFHTHPSDRDRRIMLRNCFPNDFMEADQSQGVSEILRSSRLRS